MNQATPYDPNPDRVVIALGAAGGYVPPDYAFLDGVPCVAVFGDGRVLRRVERPERMTASWREGRLSPPELVALLREIERLGFWEWDEQGIRVEIDRKPLIPDLPTTGLTLVLKEKSRTFTCYGLRQYREFHAIGGLAGPVKACDLLRELPVTELAIPERIELYVAPVTPPSPEIQAQAAPWPSPEFPFRPLPEAGSLVVGMAGGEVGPIVTMVSGHRYVSFQDRIFLIRYRPRF